MIGTTTSITMAHKVKRWEFPVERFVEYEPKDEEWCRPARIGREVESIQTVTIPNVRITSVDYGRDDPWRPDDLFPTRRTTTITGVIVTPYDPINRVP